MPVSLKLALADVFYYPRRILGACLVLLAASCLIVWVVSAYDKLVAEFEGTAEEALGHYDLFVLPDSLDETAVISEQLLSRLQADPRIANVSCTLRKSVTIAGRPRAGGGPRKGSFPEPRGLERGPSSPQRSAGQQSPGVSQTARPMFLLPTLVGIESEIAPYPLVAGHWLGSQPTEAQAVISGQLAEVYQWEIGQDIRVSSGEKELSLQVVGIVEQPESVPTLEKQGPTGRPVGTTIGPTLGMPPGAIYVSLRVAREFLGLPNSSNFLCLKLKPSVNVDQFIADWTGQLTPFADGGSYLLVGQRQLETAFTMGRMSRSIRSQAWTACGLAIMAAMFLIFTTLNTGVDERSRQIGLCRVVGLTRSQVAWAILYQALFLGIAGWLGGLVAAGTVLELGRHLGLNLTWSGVIGPYTLGLSATVTLLGAGIASVWPMLRAARVAPLDALQPHRFHLVSNPKTSVLILGAVLGTALIAVQPLLVFAFPLDDSVRTSVATTVGFPLMVAGFIFWTPALIVIAEKVFSLPLGLLLAVPRQLSRMELTRNLPRSAGACMALSVGLGVFTAMMVWGYSMLEPFKPTNWAPDLLATFQLGSLPEAELATVRSIPGVRQCLPAAVEQPKLAHDLTGSSQGTSVTRQDNIIIMGVDPDLAFEGDDPVFDIELIEGTREEAIRELRSGRACIVPDHFLKTTGLKLGDTFALLIPDEPQKSVDYKIAGVVSLPGWHWMTKFSGLRRRFGRSAALVFADERIVRQDFHLQGTNFIWINLTNDADLDLVCHRLQELADRYLGPAQPVNFQGTWAFGARTFGRSLRVTLRDEILHRLTQRANTMIWGMARLPFVTLLITLPGLMSVVGASVRTRQWEFGVMRAIGFPSSILARQILLEGTLVAAVAALLSLLFGIVAGWCGIGLSQYTSFFGGMDTPLIIPWQELLLGILATMLICAFAAIPSAMRVFRCEPLNLLLAGRGSE